MWGCLKHLPLLTMVAKIVPAAASIYRGTIRAGGASFVGGFSDPISPGDREENQEGPPKKTEP